MFYRVLFPAIPRDPRHLHHASLTALVEWIVGGDQSTWYDLPRLSEAEAARDVRERWPDSVAMPMTVRVGSGAMAVLGVLESIRSPHPVTSEEVATFEIPFVALVLAIPETTADKKPGRQFHPAAWRVPPRRPDNVLEVHQEVELRSSEIDSPILLDVIEGTDASGRRVLHGQWGAGLEMALVFPALDEGGESTTQEDWAIGKRVVGTYGGDGSGLHIEDAAGQRVMSYRDLLASPDRADARDHLPWHGPPNWPGVVMVLHPAAWTSGGPSAIERMARYFDQEVHAIAHGSRWVMVFVGRPSDASSLYAKEDCRWWAKVTPGGLWQNIAAS